MSSIKKKKVHIKKFNLFLFTLILVFLFLIVYSSIHILGWSNENNKNKKIKAAIEKNIEIIDDKYIIDWDKIKEENPDTIAYLKVPGTNINYFVVQGGDNDFYLKHNFYRDYNEAGWVFANVYNNFDGNDYNITMFAHARLDGSMFGSLRDVLKSEWQSNLDNRVITFITENEEYKYEVFSTYKIYVEDYYYQNSFSTKEEFRDFLNTVKLRSNYNYDVDVSNGSQIITLSTCDYDDNYRLVLHAIRLEEDDLNEED